MTQKVLWDLLCPGVIGPLAYSLVSLVSRVYLFIQTLLTTPPMPHTLLGTRDLIMNRTDKLPASIDLTLK